MRWGQNIIDVTDVSGNSPELAIIRVVNKALRSAKHRVKRSVYPVSDPQNRWYGYPPPGPPEPTFYQPAPRVPIPASAPIPMEELLRRAEELNDDTDREMVDVTRNPTDEQFIMEKEQPDIRKQEFEVEKQQPKIEKEEFSIEREQPEVGEQPNMELPEVSEKKTPPKQNPATKKQPDRAVMVESEKQPKKVREGQVFPSVSYIQDVALIPSKNKTYDFRSLTSRRVTRRCTSEGSKTECLPKDDYRSHGKIVVSILKPK